MKLDLAAGLHPAGGHVAVDIAIPPGADSMADGWIQADLFASTWPFRSDSVEAVRCSHFVEHVPDLVAFMDELWRVLEPDGRARIVHPYQFSLGAWQDPTHVRALNENSWGYYSAHWRAEHGLSHYPIAADFAIEEIEPRGTGRYAHMSRAALFAEAAHQVNVIDDLRVTLRARKD